MIKLEDLLLAREALVKVANSGTIPAKHAWKLAGFIDEVNDKFRHFDKIKNNISLEIQASAEDGKEIDEKKFEKEMGSLLDETVELDFSVLNEETLKHVEGLTVIEIMSLKKLME